MAPAAATVEKYPIAFASKPVEAIINGASIGSMRIGKAVANCARNIAIVGTVAPELGMEIADYWIRRVNGIHQKNRSWLIDLARIAGNNSIVIK